jgi:hypothetical protein
MGITVFKDSNDSTRTYLRITRAINGREQQRYVRVEGSSKAAMKRAMKQASEIDQRLEQWQSAVKELISLSGDNLIHDDGTIVGLQLQTRHREGRKPATEFKIRVKLNDSEPLFKSVSVDKFGFDEAFDLSVRRICELRNLSEESEAFSKLLNAKEAYRNKYKIPKSKPASKSTGVKSSAKAKEDKDEGIIGQLRGLFRKKAS